MIWTTPPGRTELDGVLESVRPKEVVIFAVDPADSAPEAFLKRLAGLVSYAIKEKQGLAPLNQITAACAQREAAVRLGLQWLEVRGLAKAAFLSDGEVQLTGGAQPNPDKANSLMVSIRAILTETAAYRHYFRSAEKDNLL